MYRFKILIKMVIRFFYDLNEILEEYGEDKAKRLRRMKMN